MKPTLLFAALCFALSPALKAEGDHDATRKEHAGHDHDHDGHDHDHDDEEEDSKKGPHGGRVIDSVAPAVEVSVTKDRKLRLTFLDGEFKAIAPGGQIVTAICGERSKPTRLSFAKGGDDEGNSLISDKVLPDGDHVALILQIKASPGEKAVVERMTLHLH